MVEEKCRTCKAFSQIKHAGVCSQPGLLKQFVSDLHSGKLHREFHHGPDPTQQPPPAEKQEEKVGGVPISGSFGNFICVLYFYVCHM